VRGDPTHERHLLRHRGRGAGAPPTAYQGVEVLLGDIAQSWRPLLAQLRDDPGEHLGLQRCAGQLERSGRRGAAVVGGGDGAVDARVQVLLGGQRRDRVG